MSLTDTMIGAQSPIQFLEEMTSFAVPSICFAIALIAIVVMQILYFKTDRLLFIIIDFVLGFAAAVSALVTMDYYTTFKQIFDANKAYMTGWVEFMFGYFAYIICCLCKISATGIFWFFIIYGFDPFVVY